MEKKKTPKTKAGSGPGRTFRIVSLPGDGIGAEVVREARKVLAAVERAYEVEFQVTEIPCGGKYFLDTGTEWPAGSFEVCRDRADAILLGAIGWDGARLPNGDLAGAGVIFGLRFGLDLYSNVRPCKLYAGVPHKIHDSFRQVWDADKVDFVIVRENTEGCYTPARGALRRGGTTEVTVDSRVITRKGSERIIRRAFEIARQRKGAPGDGKRRVTCVDKSNVMAGCQLFRAVYDEVARDYPDVARDYAYIDAFTQWMIRKPEFYDVAVTTNMLGDIATDLAAVLQGGMGIAAGGNIGDRHGMFEGIHGSAPKYTGQDKVNPLATILAAQMMLDWLGRSRGSPALLAAAAGVEQAVADVLAEGKIRTYDLGGSSRTSEVGSEVARRVLEHGT
jgi:3-isopropylmalate dehydrogenase